MKVYVNAGHDRQLDSGAVNPRLDLRECDAAYELACLVMSYLEDNGIAVHFGQNDDLYAVCDEANWEDCDLFISLHFNAFNGRASGTETLISGSTGSLMLGHCIQSNVKAVLNLPNR
ncbi:N-acetylmuramoyl-L-alanine amidase family protein, partial [Megasphaera massiliensis]